MTEREIRDFVAACSAQEPDFWKRPSAFQSLETFDVGSWKVAVYFDGPDTDWDHIDHVVTPVGETINYDDLPDAVRFWSPWTMR
jgi:hypothetical protein